MMPLHRIRGRQIGITVVRMGLLAAIAIGFAGPSTYEANEDRETQGIERVLYVVDISPSMLAKGAGEPLIAQAAFEVERRVAALPTSAQVGVVTCPSQPGYRLHWVPVAEAHDVTRAMVFSPGACLLPTLLRRVMPLLDGATKVVVISDFLAAESERRSLQELAEQEPRLSFVPVQERSANLTLRELRGDSLLYGHVQNVEAESQEATITVQCGEESTQVTRVVPGEGAAWVPLEVPAGVLSGVCAARLKEDGFSGDNELAFVVDYRPTLGVVVVDGAAAAGGGLQASQFVEAALRASGSTVSVTSVTPSEFSLDSLTSADLLMWIDPMPMDTHLESAVESFLRRGGSVVLFAGNNMQAWPERSALFRDLSVRPCAAVAERPFLVEWVNKGTEWLQPVSTLSTELLHTWRSLRHMAISFLDETQVIGARFSDGAPMVVTLDRWAGRLVVFSFVPDAENGNIAWHPLFPVVLSALVEKVRPEASEIRMPPSCYLGVACNVGSRGVMSRAFVGGEQGTTELTLSAQGTVSCVFPGVYREFGSRADRMAFMCVPAPGEIPGGEAWKPSSVGGDSVGAGAAADRHHSYDGVFLFLAMVLLFGEIWLVAGRYVRK